MKKKLLQIPVFILLFSICASAQNIDSLARAIQSELNIQVKKGKAMGLSYAIVHADSVLMSGGAGFASFAEQRKADARTVYRVGSVSKLFTALAIMQLHEAGKLNIDASLASQLPGFGIRSETDAANKITPRMLLTHHSGLPSDLYCNMFSADTTLPQSLLPELNKTYMAFEPNQLYAYSNVGYGLLGLLVEAASGLSFEDYMQQNIFGPMGMINSSFEEPANIKNLIAKGYKGKKEYNEGFIRDIGAGMMVSSAEDMTHFMLMILNEGSYNGQSIIKTETFREMIHLQNAGNPYDNGKELGLCFHMNTEAVFKNAGLTYGHGGDTEVFHASVLFVPKYNMAAVVLTNSDKGAALRSKYDDLLLTKAIETLYNTKMKKDEEKWMAPCDKPSIPLENFAGFYATPLGLMEFSYSDNTLKTSIQGMKLRLFENKAGSLSARISLLGIPLPKMPDTFSIKIVGRDTLIYQGSNILGMKYTASPILQEWKNAVGKYELLNKGKNVFVPENLNIGMQNEMLIVNFSMFGSKMSRILDCKDATRAVAIGRGRSMNDSFHIIQEDGKTYLWFSGYKYKLKEKN